MGAETLYADGLVAPLPTLLCGDNSVIVNGPPPTMASGTVDAVLTAPPPTIVSNDGTTARLSAPPPTMSSTWDYQTALTAPPPTLASDFGTMVTVTAPPPTLAASYGFSVSLAAPAPTVVITALSGAVLTFDNDAPAPTLIASETNATVIVVQGVAPVPILVAAGISSNIAAALLQAPVPQLSAALLNGSIITALLSAVAPTLSAAGYSAYTLTFAGQAPQPQITAFLTAPVIVAFRGWALNTRKGALTEYTNFPFNSYATFNGQVLGCGASGIVVLGTQALDNTTKISATGRTGKSDYDRSLLKRVPRLYLDYETDGDMIFRTITSESGTRSYLLPTNNVVGFQQRRVPVGKGPKSAFWQYEFENVDGSDFGIQAILAYPVNLRRRIQ